MDTRNIDDLYGVRFALLLLQRDEPDQALLSFYGRLAEGMTRDTFIDGWISVSTSAPTPPSVTLDSPGACHSGR